MLQSVEWEELLGRMEAVVDYCYIGCIGLTKNTKTVRGNSRLVARDSLPLHISETESRILHLEGHSVD
jgi:hypothetical protein